MISSEDLLIQAARSQSLFREVNERIEELGWRLDGDPKGGVFVCECADEACFATIEIGEPEYEELRADGGRFVVAPGHELPDVERVVRRGDRYVIVEKLGHARAEALALDPRRNRRDEA